MGTRTITITPVASAGPVAIAVASGAEGYYHFDCSRIVESAGITS
jgi:hypothetical protein